MEKYNHSKIEKKWQKYWVKHPELYVAKDKSQAPKQYILDMFPYPSSDGLHTGHVESYTATDIISRYLRMKGKNVLHPQGWDAFGLPAENFAIRTKTHPSITTERAIKNFKRQMGMMGFSYDWSREVNSSDPDYYKWTQWFFLLLYKNGLAYKAKAKANWCQSCQTVLANEQAEGGVCERCGSTVVQKDLEQWFFKITDFIEDRPASAEASARQGKTSGLIHGLDKIDWPEHTKIAQRNWIGKSEGAKFYLPVILNGAKRSEESLANAGNEAGIRQRSFAGAQDDRLFVEVFTTRLDTVFGMTFALIAPEHELISKILSRAQSRDKNQISNIDEVEKYIKEAKKKSELQRISEIREKTGVELKGIKVLNPFTKKAIPLFVSDFILAHYGTGAVMAVPGHDQRDFEFAKKFGLPIETVIQSPKGEESPANAGNEAGIRQRSLASARDDNKAYTEDGILVNSGEYTGLTSAQAREKMATWLEKEGIGKRTVNYKLRDWLVSRQRYWGAPIPIIYCEKCVDKKEQVLILHGWDGNSKSDFFPELKKNLEDKGYEVFIFDAPNTHKPNFDEWHSFINRKVKENDLINFHLIGHSLGGHLAAKLAEDYKLRSLTLVAPAGFKSSDSYFEQFKKVQSKEEIEIWKAFQARGLNEKKVKRHVEKINIVFGAKDPWITKEVRQFYIKKFGDYAKINILSEYAHMAGDEGVTKVPFIEDLFGVLHPGMMPVPEKELPVKLPKDVDFMPTGESPLARSKSFHNVKCPQCGAKARRESDTMDTFVCSSWYYLRYPSARSARSGQVAFDPVLTRKWLPVDLYVGGAEHTVLHLLYSRFFTKALHYLGYIDFDEPFAKMRHQGIILAEDGRKMSKSLGNVINPDDVVAQYGADSLRMFEMFMGPLEDMKVWNTRGIIGIYRFLERVWRLKLKIKNEKVKTKIKNQKLNPLFHKTIKKTTEDIENLRFNTAISAMMILVNELGVQEKILLNYYETFLKLLAPFAPHMTDELWSQLGHSKSIFTEKWPEYDQALVKDETIELVVQVNGKVRGRFSVPAEISEDEAKKLALADATIQKWLAGKEPKKVIFVRGKLVNIVI